jgi:hypothetical protein
MALAPFPLIGGAYLSRSLNLDAQRCVNLYPVLGDSGTAKVPVALFGTPGKRRLTTLAGTGGIRAVFKPTTGDAIVVRGGQVYRVASDWTSILVGVIEDGVTPVSIDDDGTIAVIVTGLRGYILNLVTNAFVQIADDAFYGSDYVYYTSTVFVFNRPGTRQFYIAFSDGAGGVTFDGSDFASAVSNAEPIVRHIVNHEELVLFKRTTTEIWRTVTGADFLYQRDTNAFIEKGCDATHSVAAMDNTVYWLGGDSKGGGIVWRLNGYTPERISNDGLEFAIQNYAATADAEAFTYQQEGHTFYQLNFPTAGASWAFDAATNLWHERAYRNPSTSLFERDRAANHAFFAGVHVVGDRSDGRLYALDLSYFSDDGDPLVALRSSPHIAAPTGNEVRFSKIRIDFEAGVGLTVGQGSDPVLMLRWSDDGGHTWGSLQDMRMGKIGEFKHRAELSMLGMARDRVFEISISDPVRRVILAGAVDARDMGR